ncbi:2-oxoglutarate and iron-dependent oxygenase JMJD4 homolog [Anopheles moucheti]|uniref:2-oxoglutarate and iron-dependent oxygenase JMJD4 homolog n=1 Tax=Anopheles moucheti TaxID=186751 RepID=UPI0022F071E5|nr:2-oxoglutarate and iron-dependent oxygenase JMJD4 homolog [Anopheles moucheti]
MEEIEITAPTTDTAISNICHEKIDRVILKNISYDQFFRDFMQPNRAVVVEGIATDWECFRRWVDRSVVPSKIDTAYLKEILPNIPVPIADCGKQHYNSHEKIELALFDFLRSWEYYDTNGDNQSMPEVQRNRYYLKDWHLRSECPEYSFYRTPALFVSDWLNEYLVETDSDDYRFVYIGPKGTWTAFHADVFGSYSWSVNIFGQKQWYLLPPGEEQKLLNSVRSLPFSVTEQSLQAAGVTFFSVLQQPGEAIFVPSGWYHQVTNVEDAISVNHNWFNGCNVTTIWSNLREALADVRREIDDCHDMDNFDEHCQVMLKASFGMDYADFLAIIQHVCDKRLRSLKDGKRVKQIDNYVLGRNHAMYDLITIRELLAEMLKSKSLTLYADLNDLASACLQRITFANINY